MPTETKENNPFAKINSNQVQIDEMLGWWLSYVLDGKERELEKEANIIKVLLLLPLK